MHPYDSLPRAEFAFPGPLRDLLVSAILEGKKTATTSTLAEYSIEGDALPQVGVRQVVVDSAERPVAVIEKTTVSHVPLGSVDWNHVQAEGEDHRSIDEWRTGHEQYWQSAEMRTFLGDPHFTVDDETPVVLERFTLVTVVTE